MSETSGMSNLRPASQSGPIGAGKPWPIDIEAAAESVRLARESLARMRRDGGYGDETWGPMTCLLAGAVNEVAALRAELASLRARLASAEHALTTIAAQGEPDTETGGQSGPGVDRPVDVARAALAAMEIEGDGAGGSADLRARLAATVGLLRRFVDVYGRFGGLTPEAFREPTLPVETEAFAELFFEVFMPALEQLDDPGLAPAADAKGERDAQA